MRKLTAVLVAALMLGSLASCAESPTGVPAAPPPSANNGLLDDVLGGVTGGVTGGVLGLGGVSLTTTALERSRPLSRDITVRETIDSRGGTIAIPEAGLRVVVPAGAVDRPTEFTATAIAGRAVAYEFAPHGARFARDLRVTQELRGTNWIGLPLLNFRAAYFKDRDQVDPLRALIQVDELLPLSVDLLRLQLKFEVEHFSGYGVSTGRARLSE